HARKGSVERLAKQIKALGELIAPREVIGGRTRRRAQQYVKGVAAGWLHDQPAIAGPKGRGEIRGKNSCDILNAQGALCQHQQSNSSELVRLPYQEFGAVGADLARSDRVVEQLLDLSAGGRVAKSQHRVGCFGVRVGVW